MKRAVVAIIVVASAMMFPRVSSASTQTVYGWGAPNGVVSQGSNTPTVINGIPGEITQISTNSSDSYALTSTGEVWAWGDGSVGELGNGTRRFTTTPVQVRFPAGVIIASFSNPMAYETAIAIDTTGDVWGWGYNQKFELCMKSRNLLYPEKLPLTDVTLVSSQGAHGLFYSNRVLYACGDNSAGELGDGTLTNSTRPVKVIGLPHEAVISLQSAYQNSGALMADGSYYDWGYNPADELGNGGTANKRIPVLVALPYPVTQVSQGGMGPNNGQTIAILSDGSVWAWGSDQFGQLGIGRVKAQSVPALVDVPQGVTFTQVNSGGSSMYAIDSTGAVWAWGQNNVGQLGIGNTGSKIKPVQVGIALSQISSTATEVVGVES